MLQGTRHEVGRYTEWGKKRKVERERERQRELWSRSSREWKEDSHEPRASAVKERRPMAKVATAATLVKRWTIIFVLYV